MPPEGETIGKIEKIAYTPVKSTAMIEVPEARLTPEGLVAQGVRDRTWMVVNAQADEHGVHRFATQRDRNLGRLALVQPHITPDALHLSWNGTDTISIPRDRDKGPEFQVKIWTDTVAGAVDQGDEVAEWLSDHLKVGREFRLVKSTDRTRRKVSEKYTPNDAVLKDWQDSYTVNWVSLESIAELSKRMGIPLDWTRFRPNLVVSNVPEADYEHLVSTGFFGDVEFQNAKHCDRCAVPSVNQETGEVDLPQLLKKLGEYKSWVKPSGEVIPILGEGAVIHGEGEIAVGQSVTVTNIRNPRPAYGHRPEKVKE